MADYERALVDAVLQPGHADGLTFTVADLQAMAADLSVYRPHVHTFHPEGGLCIDCGAEAQRVWQAARGWGHSA